MATNFEVNGNQPESEFIDVQDLESLVGNVWFGKSVKGRLVEAYQESTFNGKHANNKDQKYRNIQIQLESTTTPGLKVKMTVWDSAISHFKFIKPIFGEILMFKNVKISRIEDELARNLGVVAFQLNSNATTSSEISKVENHALEYYTLDNIDKAQVGKVISFRATVLEKKEQRTNLIVVKVRQREGNWHEVVFWKDKQEWTENLTFLKPRMYCSFQGIQIKANAQLTGTIYSKINIFKI